MPNESTLQAVMKTNGLSREQAAQAFQLTSQKRIDLASAIAEIKGGLPSLPDAGTTPELGAPVLPENDEASPILSFANSINQATDLARRKRNQSSVEIMAPFRGTVQASDFNSILGNLNQASDKRASDLSDQALKLQENSDELVSISDLFELNADRPAGQKIPFGITTKELAAMGITPTKSTASDASAFTATEKRKLEQAGLSDAPRDEQLDFLYGSEEVTDGYTQAEQLLADNPDASYEELRAELLSRRKALGLDTTDIDALLKEQKVRQEKADITGKESTIVIALVKALGVDGAKNLLTNVGSLKLGGTTVELSRRQIAVLLAEIEEQYPNGRTVIQKAVPFGR